ncbi:LysR family transcriptional regulator [Tistrella mobilis]|uniref:LysR family transcriptional regulator n=1 Tax=Tistrella mobilis TaxID=171437 RepID=UPI00355817FE
MTDFDPVQLRRLDPTLLLVLDEALKHRRLTLVAERLGLTPSAISHALGRLRDIYGDPLFLRRAGGIEPTPVALALAGPVRAALDALAATIGTARGFDPRTAQRVFRVAAFDNTISVIGPRLLAGLAAEAPGLGLAFVSFGRVRAVRALLEGEVDLMIGLASYDPGRLICRVLFHEGYMLAARHGHPAFVDGPPDLRTYTGLAHILVSAAGDLTGTIDEVLAERGLSRRVVAAVPHFMGALAVVADSDLVATLPERVARHHAARFGVALHPPPLPLAGYDLGVMRRAASAPDPGLDWLEARIDAAISSAPDPSPGPDR